MCLDIYLPIQGSWMYNNRMVPPCSGLYNGDEDARLAMLRQAALLGAPAIDVEYAASKAFTSVPDSVPEGTTFIMSSHNFSSTPSLKELQETEQGMREAGADVAKLAMTAQDICDAKTMLDLLKARKGVLPPCFHT